MSGWDDFADLNVPEPPKKPELCYRCRRKGRPVVKVINEMGICALCDVLPLPRHR